MHFLSVFSADVAIVERVPYADFADAIAACGEYYEPQTRGAVLSFESIVTGKRFLRAYSSLTRPDDLNSSEDERVRHRAAKDSSAFLYSKSYTFLIESEAGVAEAERRKYEDAAEDARDGNRLH